ncbi:MAG: IclR family transcriptional regulator [Actinomycetota bacterium]|nr:IclR family transcriptional regulator [Actinomycetota bacterium]
MREANLRKELAILIALGCEEAVENGGLGVVRIADLIGREKSQVSRALKTLAESGFVDRDPSTLHYRLGWRFFALAARAGEQRLLSVAPPLLERLVKNLGETAHLSVLQGTEVLTVLSESPPHAVRADGWAGRTVPVYCTSSGRVLLFDHDREALSDLLSGGGFPELRPGTVRNVEELHDRLVAARAKGYALVDEEFEFGLVGAAAPVRDFKGQLVAALNVSAPKFRLGGRLEEAGQEVKRAADELSALLGWSSDPLHGVRTS